MAHRQGEGLGGRRGQFFKSFLFIFLSPFKYDESKRFLVGKVECYSKNCPKSSKDAPTTALLKIVLICNLRLFNNKYIYI